MCASPTASTNAPGERDLVYREGFHAGGRRRSAICTPRVSVRRKRRERESATRRMAVGQLAHQPGFVDGTRPGRRLGQPTWSPGRSPLGRNSSGGAAAGRPHVSARASASTACHSRCGSRSLQPRWRAADRHEVLRHGPWGQPAGGGCSAARPGGRVRARAQARRVPAAGPRWPPARSRAGVRLRPGSFVAGASACQLQQLTEPDLAAVFHDSCQSS